VDIYIKIGVIQMEYEEKLINNTLVKVMKFPKYRLKKIEEAKERWESYLVLKKSSKKVGTNNS
jgi:hypothetical protein